MQKSYLTNYIKIYFWRGLSIVLNLLAMIIVVPRITSEPTVYGVYIVCISTAIFLSYADIGFIGAGYKYSAECFAQKDLKSEIEIQGFVSFVLAVFISVIVLFYLVVSFYPEILIKGITCSFERTVASKLFLIQALFSYNIVLQRLNNTVFGIRLEDYVFQKVQITASLISILSVYYFFRTDVFDIVGYFLFLKIVELMAACVGALSIKKRYHYNIRQFLYSFKFSKKLFDRTKSLAFSSFYVTIMWIVYNELDSIAVSKLLGVKAVAFFGIGLTISKFFRSLSSVIYSPFMARFNHMVGLNDIQGLRNLYLTVLKRTMPIIVFPVLCMLILIKPLILSWVGIDYTGSIMIAAFLIGSCLFIFIATPTSNLIFALEKIKLLYIISSVLCVVYWAGVFATIHYWKLESFGVLRLLSVSLEGIFYIVVAFKFLEINFGQYFRQIIFPVSGPVIFLSLGLIAVEPFLPTGKGIVNLLLVVLTGVIFSFSSLLLYYFTSKDFKEFVNGNVSRLIGLRKINKVQIISCFP